MAQLRNVVVVPGLPGTEEVYQPILPYLRSYNVKIVRYPRGLDQRFSTVAKHIAGLVEFDRFHLIGDSYGGPVALELTKAIPDKVATVTLTGSFTSSIYPSFIRFLPLKYMLRAGVPKLYVKKGLINDPSDEKAQVVASSVNAVPSDVLAQRFMNLALVEQGFAPPVECPMLHVRGAGDGLVSKQHADEISLKYPHAKSVEMDGPHLLFLMRPQQLSEILMTFFESLQERQPDAVSA